MKKIIVFLSIVFFNSYCWAQTKSVALEIGGNSGLFSVGYENQFKSTDSYVSFYRVGIGFIPFDNIELTLPVELGHILGKKSHHFELSTGLTFATHTSLNLFDGKTTKGIRGKSVMIYWFNRIGYRYQKTNGQFIFRLGFTPLNGRLNFWSKDRVFFFAPYGGISFGYVLKDKKQ